MVKKILFFSTFLFITFSFNLNVNAIPLGYPVVWYHENGVAHQLSDVRRDTWGDTEVYVGSTIGRISSGVDITRVDYNWYKANLCSGKTINIKGRLFGLGQNNGLFNENASLSVYSNNNLMTCTTTIIDQNQMDFNCYSDTGGGDISVYMSTVVNYNDNFRTAISRNIDVTCDVTNEAIVSQSIQNTHDIINNQNSNTNQIIQDNQQNTQDIIDNQNSNTDKEIESQKVCKNNFIDSSSITQYNTTLSFTTGQAVNTSLSYAGTTDYIFIKDATNFKNEKVINSNSFWSLCFYKQDKTHISCLRQSSYNNNNNISIPSDAYYVRFSLNSENNSPTFSYTLCQNGNQALNDSVNDLNDTLNDTSQPNTNQDINDMNDMVASDTPITDLLTLPMTLINAYYNGINSSCSPYNFGSLLGTDIIFPCIDLEQRLGSNLWLIIDSLCCIFLIYSIAMLFVHAFDSLTSLKDDFDDMYVPRHAGKHVGSGING